MASKAALLSALNRLDSMIQDDDEGSRRPSLSEREVPHPEEEEVARMTRDIRRLVEEAEQRSASEWSANKSQTDSNNASRASRGFIGYRNREDDYDQQIDCSVRLRLSSSKGSLKRGRERTLL